MGKRQRANTAQDSRRLADDGLLWSNLHIYTHKLIIRKPGNVDGASNVITVEYSCRQQGCDVK